MILLLFLLLMPRSQITNGLRAASVFLKKITVSASVHLAAVTIERQELKILLIGWALSGFKYNLKANSIRTITSGVIEFKNLEDTGRCFIEFGDCF